MLVRVWERTILSRKPGMLMGDLEQTFENVIAAEPLYIKICKQRKNVILSPI